MARSYLGIITDQGLESLFPETEHAALFLLRRAHRDEANRSLCCWAVLSETTASGVLRDVYLGRFWNALVRLNIEAKYLGTLFPATADDYFADQERAY